MTSLQILGLIVLGVVLGVVVYDLFQKKHSILRIFPLVGHFRYWLEAVGPELRQYIVTDNDEERPFNRDQRRWVYASAKRQNNYFGYGTDNDMELRPNYLLIRHSAFPLATPQEGDPGYDPDHPLPCAKVLGAHRRRSRAFRPASLINVSGMSFGSLSGPAVEAMNRGAVRARCLHNTGEGGVSRHHRHGADLIWQIGTGYFGCRAEDGGFSIKRFRETVERHPQIRALELKLSQGAKPGLGGVLPGAKVTREIAEARGVPRGEDCISPPHHSAFRSTDEMLDFIERLAEETGLPVGIKSAVGQMGFWRELARLMATTGRGVDFVTIDGSEGGTGAGPLTFTDHVALPFKVGFSRVYPVFVEDDLHDKVVFIGSGRLGFPQEAMLACALGCDLIHVGREAMMAVGCIQAKRCHTGRCPSGVATHNRWLTRGLVVEDKAPRLANYIITLRAEMLKLCHACGVSHPAELTLESFDLVDDRFGLRSALEVFGYAESWGRPGEGDLRRLMEAPDDTGPSFETPT